MQQHDDEFASLDAQVLVVTFSAAERIATYVEAHGWPFPVVADPEFQAYRAFSLPRGSWWQVAGPRAVVRYLGLMIHGKMPKKPGEGDDVKQLGGDFVLDSKGRLVYLHRSRDSTDRPSAEELLRAVGEAAGSR